MVIEPASFATYAARLFIATLVGGLIGINRDLRHKPAGLRTHAIVALGAGLVTILSVEIAGHGGQSADVSRVLQGVITGVGFLGAGVILHRDDTKGVHGLTTAAVVAVLGMAIGAGLWRESLLTTLLVLAVLQFGGPIETTIRRWRERHGQPPMPPSESP
jgi:putative Mg2+ transporter-C (MgtC) family protein